MKQLRTEYVQAWSVSRCLLLGEKKNPQNSKSLLSVFVLPTVNVCLEGDRAGRWWKPFIFLDETGQEMEESLRAAQNDVLWGPDHPPLNVILRPPPTECDFEGAHRKISAMGPEFLATALRAITVSGPSTVYHLVFIPRLLFPYCNPTEECFSTRRRKVFNSLLTNNHSSPGHRWCLQCPMSGLDLSYQKNVSKIFI